MTFADWWDIFYHTYCKGVLSFGCVQEYGIIYNKHYTLLYDMDLCDIKPIHIQQCVNTAAEYSVSRKRKVYFLLHRVFEQAIFNGYADYNPVEKVKPPKKVRKNVQLFEPEQIEQLFDTYNAESRMLLLELWTGLRRGELLALHWDNINLEKRCINVCQTIVNSDGGQRIRATTKNNRDRVVPLNDYAVQILNDIRTYDSFNGYLFKCRGSDTPMSFRTYHERYKAYYKAQQHKHNDLPYMTPHKLRHTFASYLLQCGADIETVKNLLGHTDVATTSLYVHSSYKLMQAAVNKLKFD